MKTQRVWVRKCERKFNWSQSTSEASLYTPPDALLRLSPRTKDRCDRSHLASSREQAAQKRSSRYKTGTTRREAPVMSPRTCEGQRRGASSGREDHGDEAFLASDARRSTSSARAVPRVGPVGVWSTRIAWGRRRQTSRSLHMSSRHPLPPHTVVREHLVPL